MKWPTVASLTSILVFLACGPRQVQDEYPGLPVAPTISRDRLTIWLDSLADTLVALHVDEDDTAIYRTAASRLLDTSLVVPGSLQWRGYIGQMAARVHVTPLNGLKAVWIEYGNGPGFGPNEIRCFIVDEDGKVKAARIFHGCHYHNGVLEVADLEHDGTDELKYTLVEPVQSTPVIATSSEYYSLVEDSLILKFCITTDERRTGVAFQPGKGQWITRTYRYVLDTGAITVNERTYGFAPDNFEFETEIRPRTLQTKVTYAFRFNPDSMRYVREKW